MGKKGKGRGGDAEDLDLVPIMNLVTILIPFLLMASSFVTLAAIDSTLPAIGDPSPPSETDEDKLSLSIAITDEGWTLLGADAVLGAPAEGEDRGGLARRWVRSARDRSLLWRAWSTRSRAGGGCSRPARCRCVAGSTCAAARSPSRPRCRLPAVTSQVREGL